MAKPQQNIIFWGAGATAALGIRVTQQQEKFIQCITGSLESLRGEPLKQRITESLAPNGTPPWHSALSDLITILGDRDENYEHIGAINDEEREAMRRNWLGARDDRDLENRIIGLRLIYDWPALKSVVRICPGYNSANFKGSYWVLRTCYWLQ